MFVALSYAKLNQIRKQKFEAAIEVGYELCSYISSRATALNGNAFGRNCFILEDNTIQPFAKIGDNVTLWSGNHIGHHSTINDHTFISSHVVVSGGVTIGESCFIGVNSTLRDHVNVGNFCVLGAGTVLLSDAAEYGVYSTPETGTIPRSKQSVKKYMTANWVWKKRGRLFVATGERHPKLLTHQANPLAVHLENDIFRIFYSGRDSENRSSVGAVDIEIPTGVVVCDHIEPFRCAWPGWQLLRSWHQHRQ